MKLTSKKRTPSIVNLTVKRRYLTQREIHPLMDWARKHGRYGHRDATMIFVAYRHGLRASEVCDLQWQQIELSEGRLHVHRVKNGIPSVHPIRGDEMRALRKLRRDYPRDAHVFVSERDGPISPIGFHRLIQRLAAAPCFLKSAARASRKSLLNDLRVASKEPPGFPSRFLALTPSDGLPPTVHPTPRRPRQVRALRQFARGASNARYRSDRASDMEALPGAVPCQGALPYRARPLG